MMAYLQENDSVNMSFWIKKKERLGKRMYKKKSRGWYKHKDFILIDLACLFMALILAYLIRNGSVRNLFTLGIYRNVMIFVILVDLFLIILFESYKGVLRRGRYQELRSVIRQMILIELASGLYLFTVSGGHTFSRIILYLMGIIYVLLSYCTRIIWKKRLLHKMAEGGEHSLYIVTNYDLASKVIRYSGRTGRLYSDRSYFYFYSTGHLHQFPGSDFLLTDKDWKKREAI